MKANIFEHIFGEQLSSVEFVQDYLQLRFDGPCLTAITWPTVILGSACYSEGMPKYCDALRQCIARKVEYAIAKEGDEIRIDFERNASISISLKPEDFRGPEAAVFQSHGAEGEWMAWQHK